MILSGFPAQNEAFPPAQDALDPLERWSVGLLDGDTVIEEFVSQRSFGRPGLDVMAVLREPSPRIAITTVDAAGVYRAYRWKEDQA